MEGRRRGPPGTPRGPEGALLEGVFIKEEAEWSEAEGSEPAEGAEQPGCIKQEPPQAPEHGLSPDRGHRGHGHIKEEPAERAGQVTVAPPGAGGGGGGGAGGGGVGARFAGRVVAGQLVLEPLRGRGAGDAAAAPAAAAGGGYQPRGAPPHYKGLEERKEEGCGAGGGARVYAGLVVWAEPEPEARGPRGAAAGATARARERRRRETGPYVCDDCGKTYKRRRVLIHHIRHVHDPRAKRKPYACTMCSKAYARADSLSKHRRTHEEMTQYSCGTCSKQFRRPELLERHRRSCDSGDEASAR